MPLSFLDIQKTGANFKEEVNMKKALLMVAVLAVAGCVAYVTPSGTYIEPLPAQIEIGPPVVVAPPPAYVVEPLPPVVVMPDRRLYSCRGYYYYHWDGG